MPHLKFLTLVIIGLLVQAGLGSSFAAESRIALVIGNSAYQGTPLANPANDARLMAETLGDLSFDVIAKENLNQKEMKKAIRDFGRKLGLGGVGLFYYAGHVIYPHSLYQLLCQSRHGIWEGSIRQEPILSVGWVKPSGRTMGCGLVQ